MKKVISMRDLYAWPFLAFFIYVLLFHVKLSIIGPDSDYSNTATLWIDIIIIVVSYLAAFWTIPLVLLSRKTVTPRLMSEFLAFTISTAVILIGHRHLGSGIGHLDCGYQCTSTIIPLSMEYIITAVVAISLTLSVVLLHRFAKKRASQYSPPISQNK